MLQRPNYSPFVAASRVGRFISIIVEISQERLSHEHSDDPTSTIARSPLSSSITKSSPQRPLHMLESGKPQHMSCDLRHADCYSACRKALEYHSHLYPAIYKLIGVILSTFAGFPRSTVVTRGVPSTMAMNGSTEQLEAAELGVNRKYL